MNETVLRNSDEVEDFVYIFWREVTLGEVQLVFHEWIRRLEWFCQHNGEYVAE
jgi:hypothetical protein